MASLNRVYLIGNLTRDPEIRYTSTGTAVTDLRLASSRRYRSASGEDKEEVVYVTVSVWGRQAETSSEYLSKGSPVLIEGRLRLDEWEKDGQKMSRLGVVAERVQFLGSPRRGAGMSDAPESDGPRGGGASRSPASGGSPGGGHDDFSGDDDIPF